MCAKFLHQETASQMKVVLKSELFYIVYREIAQICIKQKHESSIFDRKRVALPSEGFGRLRQGFELVGCNSVGVPSSSVNGHSSLWWKVWPVV